jgi:hypothetical protein
MRYIVQIFQSLNTYSSAIQALTAIVIAVLSYLLYRTTSKYTVLTNRIAQVTEKQLAASVQPIIHIKITDKGYGESSDQGNSISLQTQITNSGTSPIKFKAITAYLRLKEKLLMKQVIIEKENLVISPEKHETFDVFLFTAEFRDMNPHVCKVAVGVDCTDLAGVSEHSFVFDEERGLKHFFGFSASPQTQLYPAFQKARSDVFSLRDTAGE